MKITSPVAGLLCGVILACAAVWVVSTHTLNENVEGPSGYYVQVEAPHIFIEFGAQPRANGNLVSEYSHTLYSFMTHDSDVHLVGPTWLPDDRMHRFLVYGYGNEIQISGRFSSDGTSGRETRRFVRKADSHQPNKPAQHNAGSRPSSGDSSASETLSAPAPRG